MLRRGCWAQVGGDVDAEPLPCLSAQPSPLTKAHFAAHSPEPLSSNSGFQSPLTMQ
jgi:hypothetical protein